MQHHVRHVDHILKKYPELLVSLATRSVRGERRGLRSRRHRTKRLERLARFQSALIDAMEANKDLELFTCPVCRRVLQSPVTVECGHTFCGECLGRDSALCGICDVEITTNRCLNVLVQELVEKWRDRDKTGRELRKDLTLITL